jgi:RNase P subunit RPR2
MSTDQVAHAFCCAECEDIWMPEDEQRWRAYLDLDDGLVFFCPECAQLEFGEA